MATHPESKLSKFVALIALAVSSFAGFYVIKKLNGSLQRSFDSWYLTEESPRGKIHTFADKYIPSLKPFSSFPRIVHYIQHTHLDAGWIETMKDYEKLLTDDIHASSADYIEANPGLDTSRISLTNVDYVRSFINRYPHRKELFIKLIKQRKYEMLNGGIVMPDQASPNFDDLINVYEYGREYSIKMFGMDVLPRIAWAIDSFGLSSYVSRLAAEMGYEVHGFSRVTFPEKIKMRLSRNLIFNWENMYPEYNIQSFVVSNHYGFPLVAFEKTNITMLSPKFELLQNIYGFYAAIIRVAYTYREVNVPLWMGEDFSYSNFSKTVKLNRAYYFAVRCNSKSWFTNFTFKMSSVSEYLQAVKSENLTYVNYTKSDYLPTTMHTAAEDFVFWTGAFFDKPELKKTAKNIGQLVRGISNVLTRGLIWKADKMKTKEPTLDKSQYLQAEEMRFLTGILSHHDAISGVCYRHVQFDYYDMCDDATKIAKDLSKQTFSDLYGMDVKPDRNFSIILDTKSPRQKFSIINQEVGGRRKVSITLEKGDYDLAQKIKIAIEGEVLETLPSNKIHILCSPWSCVSSFYLELKPFEIASIYVTVPVSGEENQGGELSMKERRSRRPTLSMLPQNKAYQRQCSEFKEGEVFVKYDELSSELAVSYKGQLKFKVGVYYYSNKVWNTLERTYTDSGPYVFSTYQNDPYTAKPVLAVCSQDSISLWYNSPFEMSLSLIIDHNLDYTKTPFEIKLETQPINLVADIDVLLQYTFEEVEDSYPHFQTDSNGLYPMDREYTHRWKIEGNVYPLAAYAMLHSKNNTSHAFVHVDRAAGATSDQGGIIKVFVTRSNLGRDGMGSIETLQDLDSHKFSQWVYATKSSLSDFWSVLHVHREAIDFSPILYAITLSGSPKAYPFNISQAKVSEDQIGLRTLLDFREDAVMVRIYNLHGTKSITIDNVKEFIKQRYGIERDIEIEERSLDYNLPITTILNQPYMWRDVASLKKAYAEETKGTGIKLLPFKMKTYKMKFKN